MIDYLGSIAFLIVIVYALSMYFKGLLIRGEVRKNMNNVVMIYFKNGEIAKFEEVGNMETYENEIRFDYLYQHSVYHAKFYLETIGGYTYTTIVKST
ncbi:hypothetical protein [Enterococcus cecorum]|uniref:hypothetical protein n=1 Tax=Enterococcus cecorum TaxID=44008 RepID=UPI001FADCB49|nr:hypothetical protein [Enterococcus cecorum]MCJ0537372.1 hypothetical protein [Enterococcus cecorum]MCJ0545755.1 hypothetical protein [Enterococcus cecorum]MCJ0551701.1 hypothetical protein [Enterococcus cecorum]MCJ0570029.1 hypothetical protein [Enterococcus cecorum]